jgi:hypothetical protein
LQGYDAEMVSGTPGCSAAAHVVSLLQAVPLTE